MTTTANRGYTKPTVGADFGVWGNYLNTNFDILDANLAGVNSVAVSNSNVTVTGSQAQNLVQKLTGTLAANISYSMPAAQGCWIISNQTNGAYTVTVNTQAGGSLGIPVAQNTSQWIWSDGTNVYGVGRAKLGGQANLYVATTGSDTANNGLTAGTPFATIQHAVDFALQNYDTYGQTVQINVADGTYGHMVTNITGRLAGSGTLNIIGNTGTPANVTITLTSAGTIFASTHNAVTLIKGFTLSAPIGVNSLGSTPGCCITASTGSFVSYGNIRFATTQRSHVETGTGGVMGQAAACTITGGAYSHLIAGAGGSYINTYGQSLTLSGTPAFTYFAYADGAGSIQAASMTFSGSATGARFICTNGGYIACGGGLNYFPGNSAGTNVNGYYG